jgi:hypothetical protein
VPIHKEGYPFILIGIVLTVVLGYFSQFFGWIFLIPAGRIFPAGWQGGAVPSTAG